MPVLCGRSNYIVFCGKGGSRLALCVEGDLTLIRGGDLVLVFGEGDSVFICIEGDLVLVFRESDILIFFGEGD